MATLYVENVPDELYKALRKRAKDSHSSIAREVISILKDSVPTAAELAARRRFAEEARRIRSMKPLSPGPFPSAEEMIREDRDR